MSKNISLFGLSAHVKASNTFPAGFLLSAWADDQPPLDAADLEIASHGMGPNGDMVVWQKPAVIPLIFSVIPNSEDDRNLTLLLEANRISKNKGKVPLDEITVTLSFQDGRVVTLIQGIILSGPAAPTGSQDGRLSSRKFGFGFEDKNENRPS